MASGVSLADPVIETSRLRLRHMRHDDLDALFQIWGDPHAMRFYPAPLTREQLAERMEVNLQRYANIGHGLYTILLKTTGEIMGDCGPTIQRVDDVDEVEIGYHLIPRFWGHGYAAEAARATRDWAFEHLPCPRVISLIRPENVPSQNVARRNDMSIAKRVLWRDLEHDVWSITRAEWQILGTATASG